MDKKLKSCFSQLQEYESKLDKYCFCNFITAMVWNTDYNTGSAIAELNGTLTNNEFFEILVANNPNSSRAELEEKFINIFNFLEKEGLF
ncbi:hypothetical protein J6S88_08045 [bacterium]|nr:hypothetical protein [bacterium]